MLMLLEQGWTGFIDTVLPGCELFPPQKSGFVDAVSMLLTANH